MTSIEWTRNPDGSAGASWNYLAGCSVVSPGCTNCYAMRQAARIARMSPDLVHYQGLTQPSKAGPVWTGRVFPAGFDKLVEPIRRQKPQTYFVNSMSDLFHKDVPDDYIVSVARVMTAANWHTYQVLTKRADRLQNLLKSKLRFAAEQNHIWWGVSVENRRHGLPRIDLLRQAPAKVRFLSVEPLLEHLGAINLKGINWVIVGGESGPGARPMEAAWVRSIRAQCRAADVAFFFKQWGGVRKSTTGRSLDGRTYSEFPEREQIEPPALDVRREKLERLEAELV